MCLQSDELLGVAVKRGDGEAEITVDAGVSVSIMVGSSDEDVLIGVRVVVSIAGGLSVGVISNERAELTSV